MEVIDTAIADVKILIPRRFADPRGVFCETYNQRTFQKLGFSLNFVQDNHSISTEAGTVRGLHFQAPPFAQDKLIRVTRGRVLDVAVDIRRNSPTFGRHVAVEISSENWKQVLVPIGFAHGFVTLEPNTEVIYKVTSFYSPQHDRGIFWADEDLAINWGITASQARLSDKDSRLPRFKDLAELF